MQHRSARITDLALLLVLATLWGASYAFIRVAVESIPPLTLMACRTLIAAGLLAALLRVRGIALPRTRGPWQQFAVQALLNSVLPFTLLAWAQQEVGAGLAAILNSCAPLFVFLGTWAWSRQETVTWTRLLGVLIGLAGTGLVIGAEALQGTNHHVVPQLAIVLATVCYAGAALYGRSFQSLDPATPAAGSLLCGAVVLLPACIVIDRPWTLSPSSASVVALVALSVFSTALALVIYFRLIATVGSLATAAQAYLRVPIAVAIGVLFLGESLAPTAWTGLACVVIGVAAMNLRVPRAFSLSALRRRHCFAYNRASQEIPMTQVVPFHKEAGSGPTVLCLHSNASHSGQWRGLMEQLSDRFRVVAVDSYGSGRTAEWPSDRVIALADEVELLQRLLDGAAGPVYVVGHSYGAAVALKAALLHPRRVAALALYEPTVFAIVDRSTPHEVDGIRNAVSAGAERLDAGDAEGAARSFIDFWMGSGSWDRMPAERKPAIVQSGRNLRRWGHALFTEPVTAADLHGITAPVLLMTGDRSPRSSLSVADLLADNLPNVRRVRFPELGHMGPITHPEPVNAAIARFLGEVVR